MHERREPYRYFPAKRELLLYGLRPEAQTFVCAPFGRQHAALRAANPDRYLELFVDHQVEMALFVRPSVRAAAELGLPTLSAAVHETVDHAAEEFAGLVSDFVPGATGRDLAELGRALRRSLVGALFDPSVSRRELRATMRALIEGTALAVGDRRRLAVAGARDGSPALPSASGQLTAASNVLSPRNGGREPTRGDTNSAGQPGV